MWARYSVPVTSTIRPGDSRLSLSRPRLARGSDPRPAKARSPTTQQAISPGSQRRRPGPSLALNQRREAVRLLGTTHHLFLVVDGSWPPSAILDPHCRAGVGPARGHTVGRVCRFSPGTGHSFIPVRPRYSQHLSAVLKLLNHLPAAV